MMKIGMVHQRRRDLKMKRCLMACRGCYWFGNFEDGEDGLDYNCIGTDDTWCSKKEYEELEVPDDCPYQDLHEELQDEKSVL
jgi:L,D-peptidoglycan transpeptidase YkuD (ErfK/YbiS/YcfS/YnhG family)